MYSRSPLELISSTGREYTLWAKFFVSSTKPCGLQSDLMVFVTIGRLVVVLATCFPFMTVGTLCASLLSPDMESTGTE